MTQPGDSNVDSQGQFDKSHSGGMDSTHMASSRPSSSQPSGGGPLWNNHITLAGAFLAIIGLLGLLTFGLFHLAAPVTNPYVDIVGYLLMPGILLLGLIAMPLGILLRSWRLHRRDPQQKLIFGFPRIDLNDPSQRRAAKVVLGGTFILLPVVGVSSYQGYHFTDSVTFCSQACHTVMEPQAVAYARSGHARVPCAACHIGSGASWFVKAKFSGTRQVLAVLRDSYSRPIPPAIEHLRPARETCEQCHWPEKFFGAQLADLTRFASDENNAPHEIRMLLKTGGGSRSAGRDGGIHMHIAWAGRIEYVAADDKLQNIPWVKMTGPDGNEVIFRSDGQPHSAPKPEGRTRSMDCMDCHNRPAHNFLAPADAVDIALREGTIDPRLPFIKREAVAALVHPYPDAGSAEDGIAAAITGFYSTNRLDVSPEQRARIRRAIETVTEIYRTNVFSHMRVDWRTYPDNIGHKTSPGCFRCHDGRHIDQDGNAIIHACDACHTFLNRVDREGESTVLVEGEFIHPIKLEGRHAELRCDRCHDGGAAPQRTCAGCHTAQADFRAGTSAAFEAYDIPAEPMAGDVGCQDCHDRSQSTGIEVIDLLCVECHDEEYQGMPASWRQEVDGLLDQAETRADTAGQHLLGALRRAGPLHNVEATRMIVRRVIEGSLSATPTNATQRDATEREADESTKKDEP